MKVPQPLFRNLKIVRLFAPAQRHFQMETGFHFGENCHWLLRVAGSVLARKAKQMIQLQTIAID